MQLRVVENVLGHLPNVLWRQFGERCRVRAMVGMVGGQREPKLIQLESHDPAILDLEVQRFPRCEHGEKDLAHPLGKGLARVAEHQSVQGCCILGRLLKPAEVLIQLAQRFFLLGSGGLAIGNGNPVIP